MNKKTVDLTQGAIWKQMILFSLPILVGYLFQNLYNSVDSLVVGNFVGKSALAAVNACSPISNLLVGFFTGMSTGASVVFSRCFGARDYQKLKESIHTTVLFAVILGVSMAAVGILMSSFLLHVVDCPADVFPEADAYLNVYIAGILFTAIYNVGAGILRAVGDSRSPFYALVAASITNIVLDVVFVTVVQLGVLGVAVATILAQFLSVVLVFGKLLRADERYRLDWRALKINKTLLLEVVDLGLPAGLQTCMISISNMFVQRYINGFGSTAMAGVGVAQRLDKFASMPCQSIGLATTTFVSQNIGANRRDRIARGMKVCFGLCLGSVALIGIPLYFASEPLVALFNRDPEVIRYGVAMMHTIIPLYITMAVNQLFSGALRGFGHSKAVMFLSLIGMIGARQLFLYLSMRINPVIDNVFYGYPLAWGVSALTMVIYYFWLKRNHQLG